jgi:hypothetical protein
MRHLPQWDKDGGRTVMDSGKRMIGGLAAVLFLAVFPQMAEAAPAWRHGPSEREQNRQDFQPERRGPGYSRSGESFRRSGEKDAQRDMRRQRRLSPEERSQLRRDIRDAGREIYPSRHH